MRHWVYLFCHLLKIWQTQFEKNMRFSAIFAYDTHGLGMFEIYVKWNSSLNFETLSYDLNCFTLRPGKDQLVKNDCCLIFMLSR